jgi:4-deoxy-L-threo-5-hexosulose-uronate ketol-isomerase
VEQRYASNPESIRGLDTAGMRQRYLISDLFTPDAVKLVYTHHDRIVLGGIVPAQGPLTLSAPPELRAVSFFDNREAGIVNLGGPGTVEADGVIYDLPHGACLYLGRGTGNVEFASTQPSGDSGSARFYLFSAPAHTTYPAALVRPGEGNARELGDPLTSNRRTLNQYIHADGIASCQVVMGVTTLHPGSMWNTMPAHTHDRRTECYVYFDLPADARVVHLFGEPTETRHLIVAEGEAVISPSWSIHSGVGTASYSFVWAMAGENKTFDDMDPVPPTALL